MGCKRKILTSSNFKGKTQAYGVLGSSYLLLLNASLLFSNELESLKFHVCSQLHVFSLIADKAEKYA